MAAVRDLSIMFSNGAILSFSDAVSYEIRGEQVVVEGMDSKILAVAILDKVAAIIDCDNYLIQRSALFVQSSEDPEADDDDEEDDDL